MFEQNSVFQDKKVNKYLSALCDKYVVVPADKASKYNGIVLFVKNITMDPNDRTWYFQEL